MSIDGVCLPSIYDDIANNNSIVKIHYENGEKTTKKIIDGEIIIVLEGQMLFSASHIAFQQVVKKDFFAFLPPGVSYDASFTEDTILVVFQMKDHIYLFKQFVREIISEAEDTTENKFTFLQVKKPIKSFINILVSYLDDGLINIYLFDIKIKEFFILMKRYYSVKELIIFIQPILSPNVQFSYFILQNYDKIKTVKEFAQKAKLSLSGFEKEFRKTFKTSPYQWMKQKRKSRLLYQIIHTTKPFKVISEECGFSSTSQMSDYCKKEWDKPPGKIRKENKEHNDEEL